MIINCDFNCISQDLSAKLLSHLGTLFHSWRRIDLNKPWVEFIIKHDIISIYLKCIFGWSEIILNTLQTVYDYFLDSLFNHIIPHIISVVIFKTFGKLMCKHHVPFDQMFVLFTFEGCFRNCGSFFICLPFLLFLNSVISEMDKSIHVSRVIVIWWESNIRFSPNPHCEGIPICNEYPYSNVKFPILDNQWVFDIFLCNPLCFSILKMINNIS